MSGRRARLMLLLARIRREVVASHDLRAVEDGEVVVVVDVVVRGRRPYILLVSDTFRSIHQMHA